MQQPGLRVGQVDAGDTDLGQSQPTAPLHDRCHQRRTVDLSTTPSHPPIVESPARPGSGSLTLSWAGEDDTQAFAARLAAHGGIADAFIALHGDLGAGKTTFVRHLLRALGVRERIKSPTYTVMEPHEAGGVPIYHFDFYRFNDPREWEDAGFRDVFAGPGLKVAEWPEKAAGLLPTADLVIRIEADPDEVRHVELKAQTPLGRELLK